MKKIKYSIIKYPLLFSSLLFLGGSFTPEVYASELSDECVSEGDNEEYCRTQLKYLSKDTKNLIANYPGKSKNGLIYYQSSYQAVGGFANSAGDSYFVSEDGPRHSTTSHLDIQNYLDENDIGKEVEITFEGKGMSMEKNSQHIGLQYLSESYGLNIRNHNVDVELDYGETTKVVDGIEFTDKYTLKFPAVSDNIILTPFQFSRVVDHTPNLTPHDITNIYDFSRHDNSFIYMKLKVGGELRYYGKAFEYFNGRYDEEYEFSPEFENYLQLISSGGIPFDDSNENFSFIEQNRLLFDHNPDYNIYYKKGVKTGLQDINANILSGGITGGIINVDLDNGLSVKDVDFGNLKIGKQIAPINQENMVSVRDWTGGSGWKLTAQHKNAKRNNSLQLGVQVDNREKINLNEEAQTITKGQSQLEVIKENGKYFAEWGTHPTVGDFNNVIEWNLSANVTE